MALEWPWDGPGMAPGWPQDGPGMAPGWPPRAPERPRDGPGKALGWPQDSPGTALGRPWDGRPLEFTEIYIYILNSMVLVSFLFVLNRSIVTGFYIPKPFFRNSAV